jgi:hypothetical protein
MLESEAWQAYLLDNLGDDISLRPLGKQGQDANVNSADLPGRFCGNLDRFISHWLRTLGWNRFETIL